VCVDNFMRFLVRAPCVEWRVVVQITAKLNYTADLGGSSALLDEITKCYKGKASAAILMIGVVIFYKVEV